jgi:hypothetical protein
MQIFSLLRKGDLIGLKQLFELNPDIVISALNEDLFCWACADGYLHVAQWLLQVKPKINISAFNEKAFRMTCENGQLDVCKWLLQVKPDINISVNNEFAFRCACIQGHLQVCQWLLHVKQDIDISALDDYAFKYVCYKAHLQVPCYLQVAQWLQSLKPYLYVIEYDEDGAMKDYRIREKEEANWEKRKYLIWLASNNCQEQNKSNLLYKLPSDVSRMVIGFV